MILPKTGRSLLVSTITSLIFASLGIVGFSNFTTQQASDAADTMQSIPKLSDRNPQPLNASVTIQAVGDVIPGTNYPNRRLPKNSDRLINPSIRTHFKRADILFGNLETTLTNHPHTTRHLRK